MEIRQVEKKSFLTLHDFERYMTAGGEPVIIEHWMDQWAAMKKWDLPFFRENFGDDRLQISSHLVQAPVNMEVPLHEFVDYIENPDHSRIQQVAELYHLDRPFYAYGFKPFQKCPDLFNDFSLPPFVEDWFDRFSPAFQRCHFPYRQGWVLLGPAGTISHLHQDAYATIAWLAQIRGRKRCWLFSPQDTPFLYGGKVDPLNPDHERYPKYHRATLYEAVLEPGTMIFLPPRWWHHVQALSSSVTLSYNIVNHINLSHYLRYAYGDALPQILGALPDEIRLPQATPLSVPSDPG